MNDVYDLKMYVITNIGNDWTHGKRAIQACHAAVAIITNRLNDEFTLEATVDTMRWIEGSFAKVGIKVPSREALERGLELAKSLEVPNVLIHDNGTTQNEGDEGVTGAIGPFDVTRPEYAELVAWLKGWKLW